MIEKAFLYEEEITEDLKQEEKLEELNPFKENTLFHRLFQEGMTSRDWQKEEKVTSVKSQGECGSCWSHVAIASVESLYLIEQNKKYNLSEQQILNCSKYGDCIGGYINDAFFHIYKFGAFEEADGKYFYKKLKIPDECTENPESKNDRVMIKGFAYTPAFDAYLYLTQLYQ